MASHADPSVAQVQQEFQALMAYVTGPETASSTAYEVERTLFRRLLGLGLALLQLFFLTRAAERLAPPPCRPAAPPWVAHGRRSTTYVAVFGKLTFERHAFWAPGQPVVCPLDAALSLPKRCYSDLLREWAAFGSTDAAYRETQALLARILRVSVSVQALEIGLASDAVDVAPASSSRPVRPGRPAWGASWWPRPTGRVFPSSCRPAPPARPAAARATHPTPSARRS